jgi:ribosomal protein S18 acetylase RimI-like enzyme
MNLETRKIRPYNSEDETQVLALFNLNYPKFFAVEEKSDFIFYLHSERELYFVVEYQNEIVACGGINFINQDNVARISWDIVSPHFQQKGFGKQLLEFRMRLIEENHNNIEKVVVRTSQHVYQFYEKSGFKLVNIVENYWAKDFHLYEMHLSF